MPIYSRKITVDSTFAKKNVAFRLVAFYAAKLVYAVGTCTVERRPPPAAAFEEAYEAAVFIGRGNDRHHRRWNRPRLRDGAMLRSMRRESRLGRSTKRCIEEGGCRTRRCGHLG